eukprot:m51a1_g287 putative glucokinase (373) ;mRNA; r:330668-332148
MPFTLSDSALKTINSWIAEAKAASKALEVYIGVDIGATNTRVGIARLSHCTDFVELVYTSEQAASRIVALFAEVGEALKALGVAPQGAAIAAAGPIAPGRVGVEITNWASDNKFDLEALPETLFPKGRTSFLNDLEACCFGLLALDEAAKLAGFFETLWGETGIKLLHQNYLVMAMGTGLGVAMLLWVGNRWRVVPMEIGHVLLPSLGTATPSYAADESLIKYLGEKLYNGKHGVEYEDICSGRGLVAVYAWLLTTGKSAPALDDAGKIAHAAANGDAVAREAVFIHYKFLFRCAQNTCVGLQTKGVLLAGDNQVKNRAMVKSMAEGLREEFHRHPKADKWVAPVPVFSQLHKVNTNMIGALHVAANPESLH